VKATIASNAFAPRHGDAADVAKSAGRLANSRPAEWRDWATAVFTVATDGGFGTDRPFAAPQGLFGFQRLNGREAAGDHCMAGTQLVPSA
jgi:hypothetical protein